MLKTMKSKLVTIIGSALLCTSTATISNELSLDHSENVKILPFHLAKVEAPLEGGSDDEFDLMEELQEKLLKMLGSSAGDMIADAIFGAEGPNYVYLHQIILDRIQQMVNEVKSVYLDTVVLEAERELQTLQDLLGNYHASVLNGNPDLPLLNDLLIISTRLSNHEMFTRDWPRELYYVEAHFVFTKTFELLGTVNLIIEKEYSIRRLQGNDSQVRQTATKLISQLTSLRGSAIKYVNANIWLRPNNCQPGDILSIRNNSGHKLERNIYESNLNVDMMRYPPSECWYEVVHRFKSSVTRFHPDTTPSVVQEYIDTEHQKYLDEFTGENYSEVLIAWIKEST